MQISDVIEQSIVIAAGLTVASPFIRIPESRSDISGNRRDLFSDEGDPFTLLNIFSEWLKVKTGKKVDIFVQICLLNPLTIYLQEASRNWCRRHGIEEQRLYEIVKLKTQFEQVLMQYLGQSFDDTESNEDTGARNKRKRNLYEEREDDDDDGSSIPFWKVNQK